MPDISLPSQAEQARREWMGVLARASLQELEALAAGLDGLSGMRVLRAPESGLALIQAEAGAGGTSFHLGEITVTRCALITPAGLVGHAYVAGRSHRHAWLAAALDGLLQDAAERDALMAAIVAPLRMRQEARHAARAARAGETRVEFFTMVRESAA